MTSTREYRVRAETMPVSKILWAGSFDVPWHQREFDWDPEHIMQFWNDIRGSYDSGEPDYFIGGITLTEEGDRNFGIQDGQQRLTTYSMMIAVLRDVLPPLYTADANRVVYDVPHGDYLENMSEGTPRIKHQEGDKQKYLVITRGSSITPNGKLSKAHDILKQEVNQMNEEQAGKLFEYLMNSVIANKTINGTGNATQVFETLNDRGKKLSAVDLLRNFLYSHLKGPQTQLHRDVHNNLEAMKQSAKSEGYLATYVHCALECRYGHIRKNYLYQDAKNEIESEIKRGKGNGFINAEETVRDLSKYLSDQNNINAFKSVFNGDEHGAEITAFANSARATNRPRNMCDYVRELKHYKVALPATFAAVARFLKSDAAKKRGTAIGGHKIVQCLNALIMRTASVQRSFIPSAIEEAIAQWGKEIMEDTGSQTTSKIIAEIIQTDPEQIWDDGAFEYRMNALRIPNNKDANSKMKRILYALYRYEQSDIPLDKSLTLEHILPESVAHIDGWRPHFDEDNHESYTAMLGNMTLLSSIDNKNTKGFNQSFGTKKETFKNSSVRANRHIAENTVWTPESVSERQRSLAILACKVWSKPQT